MSTHTLSRSRASRRARRHRAHASPSARGASATRVRSAARRARSVPHAYLPDPNTENGSENLRDVCACRCEGLTSATSRCCCCQPDTAATARAAAAAQTYFSPSLAQCASHAASYSSARATDTAAVCHTQISRGTVATTSMRATAHQIPPAWVPAAVAAATPPCLQPRIPAPPNALCPPPHYHHAAAMPHRHAQRLVPNVARVLRRGARMLLFLHARA